MFKFFRRGPTLNPDINAFHTAIVHSVYGRSHQGDDVAGDFRILFNKEPQLGQRVLFMLLTWCGEYDDPPESNDALQRWAGKRELAGKIKAAMFADLSTPEPREEIEDNVRNN